MRRFSHAKESDKINSLQHESIQGSHLVDEHEMIKCIPRFCIDLG